MDTKLMKELVKILRAPIPKAFHFNFGYYRGTKRQWESDNPNEELPPEVKCIGCAIGLWRYKKPSLFQGTMDIGNRATELLGMPSMDFMFMFECAGTYGRDWNTQHYITPTAVAHVLEQYIKEKQR